MDGEEYSNFMDKYKIGDIVTGKVTGIEKYGIFLSLADGVTGLIHISEISSLFVRNISDFAELGEEIRAKVIDVDLERKHLRLSIKDLEYRNHSKKRQPIVETEKGFSSLEESLNHWVLDKLNEIDKKN